jgi:hypothetical protein
MITAAIIRARLSLDPSVTDATIDAVIASMIEVLETYLDRGLQYKARTETVYWDEPGPVVSLFAYPIDAAQTMAIDGITIKPEDVQITNGLVLLRRSYVKAGSRSLTVNYTAGYQQMPGVIDLAVLYLIDQFGVSLLKADDASGGVTAGSDELDSVTIDGNTFRFRDPGAGGQSSSQAGSSGGLFNYALETMLAAYRRYSC